MLKMMAYAFPTWHRGTHPTHRDITVRSVEAGMSTVTLYAEVEDTSPVILRGFVVISVGMEVPEGEHLGSSGRFHVYDVTKCVSCGQMRGRHSAEKANWEQDWHYLCRTERRDGQVFVWPTPEEGMVTSFV